MYLSTADSSFTATTISSSGVKECDYQSKGHRFALVIFVFLLLLTCIYRVFQNLCHKLFLGIPHPKISKKVPISMGPKMNRFRDIDLHSCAGTLLSIT